MKRFPALVLVFLFMLSTVILPVCAADTLNENDSPMAERITVSAKAAILINMDTGETLYEYDADEQNYPASTTKVMTAYLCLKYGDPKDIVTVSSSAFSNISQRASTGGLVVGETMTVHRLLQALLVVSASEAANVVGEYISGSHEEFVNLMNEEAQALGCTGTHFANCHGLPNPDHYVTARDMAIIATAAMQYEEFREIVGSAVTTMEKTNKHGAQVITSTNGILPGSSYPNYNYEYAIGIKTGHTEPAGYCLISAADKDGLRLLCVVLGCGSRTSSFDQTIKLYDWGYENYDLLTQGDTTVPTPEPVEPEEEPSPTPTPTPTPSPSVAPTPEPTPVQLSAQPAEAEVSEGVLEGINWEALTGPMLPLTIVVCAIIVVILILIVVVIVLMVKRRKQ
ncbi:MAG: D-alanyl-D-alanine carboxypeptidase [Oscillospiraceae bacterium]|nr:D-alanyl-D-alanine carboxypeptidase [Oscillospiraceae bacterium]